MAVDTILFGRNGLLGSAIFSELSKGEKGFSAPSSQMVNLTDQKSIEAHLNSLELNQQGVHILVVASKMPYSSEVHDDFDVMIQNVWFAEMLTRAIAPFKIAGITYISTIDVYGNPTAIINENSPLKPASNYAIFKLAAEQVLQKHCNRAGIPLLRLRVSHIIGKNDKSRKVVNSFIDSAIVKHEIEVNGSSTSTRDFVSAEDVAKITVDLTGRALNEVINIASGNSISMTELASLISAMFEQPVTIKLPTVEGTPSIYQFDIGKLRTFTNYQFTPINQSLKEIFSNRKNELLS